jgi:hypothetical protein
MRRAIPTFVFAGMAALLAFAASGAPYLQDDLEALDRSEAWDELRLHLTDIPPAKRGPRWNEMAEHACLQRQDDEKVLESCARLLNAASAADSNNKEFALRVGKYFGKTEREDLAIPFFVRAVTEPDDPHCGWPELGNAVLAGLHLSPTYDKPLLEQTQNLAFSLCWSELQPKILDGFNSYGAWLFLRNACPTLMRKVTLPLKQRVECERAMAEH